MSKRRNNHRRPDPKLISPSRRQAISMMGLCGLTPFIWDPVNVLIRGLVEGIIQKAQADTLPGSVPPRNYIYVNLSGGPPRWYWDLPLKPYGSPGFVSNPRVATRFVGTGTTAGNFDYVTTSITRNGTTVQMPYLWSQTIPTPAARGGAWVPMAQLLDNMLMIRGVNMLADGHADNNRKQVRPLIAQPSLHGRIADNATTPLPAVEVDGAPGSSYKSAKGIGQTFVIERSDPLSAILSPFNRAGDGLSATYMSRRAALESAMNRALASLGDYASSAQPGAADLFTIRGRAEALIKQGITGVAASYTTLHNKYLALISACADWSTNPMPGITDKAINSADYTGAMAGALAMNPNAKFSGADLRSIITSNSNLDTLAAGFAVSEYLITQGYSSAVMFGMGRVMGIDQMIGNQWTLDEHFTGTVGSILVNSFLYRGLSACLLELVTVLKEQGKFGESVIQVGSEFSRAPYAEMNDSGHGWQANCTSVISGAITQPLVVGNQLLDANPGGSQRGTWGVAAKTKIDGNDVELAIGNSTSTVAHLLRIKPLVVNNSTLVTENAAGGGVSPNVDLATTKDGG